MFLRVVMVINKVAVKLVCSRFVRRNGKKKPEGIKKYLPVSAIL